MNENLLEDITIYHKSNNTYVVYHKVASVRCTSIRNRTNTGKTDNDNVLIRIFDIENYGTNYNVEKDDVIVRGNVNTEVTNTPLTTLRAVHGKDKVYLVRSIDIFNFSDNDLNDLEHIKIGAI